MSNLLLLGEVAYDLDHVLKHSKTGPNIIVEEHEINNPADNPAHNVEIRVSNHVQFKDDGSIVFYKQHGGYTVLLGKHTADNIRNNPNYDRKLHGYLMSTVALKKSKIQQ